MVPAAKHAGFLQRQNISWLFHHTKKLNRATRIRADVAQLVRCEIAAKFAGTNPFTRFGNRAGNLFGLIALRLNHPKRDSFGRSWTNARHLSKLRNQIPQRGWIFRLSHEASPTPVRLAPRTALLTPVASAFRTD